MSFGGVLFWHLKKLNTKIKLGKQRLLLFRFAFLPLGFPLGVDGHVRGGGMFQKKSLIIYCQQVTTDKQIFYES